MGKTIYLFVFALIISAAAFVVAGEKNANRSAGRVEYEAELSKADVPGMKAPDTKATGEATFELSGPGVTGKGAGGTAESESGRVQDDVPGAGATDGRGTGSSSYEGILNRPGETGKGGGGGPSGEVLRYKLNVRNIENVTAAHLHMGGKGTAEGPVVAPLYTGPRKTGEFSGMLSEGMITAGDLKGPLSGKSVADLAELMDEGNVYVNVHTAQNPGGEIRGQVKPE
jgi:hypothetical protein